MQYRPCWYLESSSPIPSQYVCACVPKQQRTSDGPLIVRYIPDWFPGAKFKRLAKDTRDKFKTSVDGPLEYVKNAMKVRVHNNPRLSYIFNVTTSPERGFLSP